MHTCTGGAFCCCLFFPQGLLGGAAVALQTAGGAAADKNPASYFPGFVLSLQKLQPVTAASQADGLGVLQRVDAVAALDALG